MKGLSNIDAIYAEYPFLENHIKREGVVKATVARWDTNSIRDEYPRKRKVTKYYKSKRLLWLLNADGNTITRVGNEHVGCGGIYDYSETLGQALSRIGTKTEEVCFGLEMDYCIEKVRSGLFSTKDKIVPKERLILHKLPKDITNGKAWIDSIAEEGRKAVQNL